MKNEGRQKAIQIDTEGLQHNLDVACMNLNHALAALKRLRELGGLPGEQEHHKEHTYQYLAGQIRDARTLARSAQGKWNMERGLTHDIGD